MHGSAFWRMLCFNVGFRLRLGVWTAPAQHFCTYPFKDPEHVWTSNFKSKRPISTSYHLCSLNFFFRRAGSPGLKHLHDHCCIHIRPLLVFHTIAYRFKFAPQFEIVTALQHSHDGYRAQRVKSDKHKSQDPAQAMDAFAKALSALHNKGFRRSQVTRVLAELREASVEPELEPLVPGVLGVLSPSPP